MKLREGQIGNSKDIRLHFCKESLLSRKMECVICSAKTKNYCIQCSETKKSQIGFCGSPICYEKHNAVPAMLLNEKSAANLSLKKKNNFDRAYESSTEGNSTFSSNAQSRFRFGQSYKAA